MFVYNFHRFVGNIHKIVQALGDGCGSGGVGVGMVDGDVSMQLQMRGWNGTIKEDNKQNNYDIYTEKIYSL